MLVFAEYNSNCNDQIGDVAGYLVHKEYLPVLEMHFGDTGTLTDTKIGYHMLGKLECFGDSESPVNRCRHFAQYS